MKGRLTALKKNSLFKDFLQDDVARENFYKGIPNELSGVVEKAFSDTGEVDMVTLEIQKNIKDEENRKALLKKEVGKKLEENNKLRKSKADENNREKKNDRKRGAIKSRLEKADQNKNKHQPQAARSFDKKAARDARDARVEKIEIEAKEKFKMHERKRSDAPKLQTAYRDSQKKFNSNALWEKRKGKKAIQKVSQNKRGKINRGKVSDFLDQRDDVQSKQAPEGKWKIPLAIKLLTYIDAESQKENPYTIFSGVDTGLAAAKELMNLMNGAPSVLSNDSNNSDYKSCMEALSKGDLLNAIREADELPENFKQIEKLVEGLKEENAERAQNDNSGQALSA